MHICSICGYGGLEFPQWDKEGFPTFTICDCCGFESGFDDEAKDKPETIEEYRERWLREGAIWFSSSVQRPENWDLRIQLKNIDIDK